MESAVCDQNLLDDIESISNKLELGVKLKDDSTNTEDVGGSTKTKGKGKIKGKKQQERKYYPRNAHEIKILRLLGVDRHAIYDLKKLTRGYAKVDPPWIDKFSSVDWSEAFTEEGHFRLLRIIPMLPRLGKMSDAHISLWRAYRRVQVACMGLEDYNKKNEGAEYDLVESITAQPAIYIDGTYRGYSSHCNFLAKRKDDHGSSVELFFAEVLYDRDEVVYCCLLEPRLFPPDITPPLEKVKFDRKKVIHPEGVECLSCKRVTRRYL